MTWSTVAKYVSHHMAKRTNYDLQNTTQKTKDWETRTSLKTGDELRWFGMVSSSWFVPDPQGSHDSWIYNYLCNQCLSSLTLWVQIQLRRGVVDTTLCDKVCQWLATGQWFSPDTPLSYRYSFRVRVMVFHATFNNISVISWLSVLLV
jgi:hypothetical protein